MLQRLPNAELAYVPREKLVDYLLDKEHEVGWSKAKFLYRFGFVGEEWPVLEEALLRHALEAEVVRRLVNPYGEKYELEGPLEAPDGRRPRVRTIWLIQAGEEHPRFVTLDPSKRRLRRR